VAAALAAWSCAAPLLTLPAGAGVPAVDGASVVDEATAACRQVSSLVAEAAVSGSVDGQRVRGRLHLGVAAPAFARLEAIAPFGQPVFIFVAGSGRATLLLTRPDRVLEHDNPEQVLEAITGVPLDSSELRTTLTGCAIQPAANEARELGPEWRLVRDGQTELYLQRRSPNEPWRVAAAIHQDPGRPAWRAEYSDFESGLPRTLRLVSSQRDQFDLRLALSQVDVNMPLETEAFELKVPAAAEPLTLEELREAGPLASSRVTTTGAGER
jgi:hypothetical protein